MEPEELKSDNTTEEPILESKLILLGDLGVGKSSIIIRYVNDVFNEAHLSTLGASFFQKLIRVSDGIILKLGIWDTAGQERFNTLARMYYRQTQAALILYDVSNERSLENCENWVNELRRTEENCILCLVANKIDLPAEEKKVNQRDVNKLVEKFGMMHFDVSAKTGENVNRLFEAVAQEIVRKINKMG
jgi:small GTP-binding protein